MTHQEFQEKMRAVMRAKKLSQRAAAQRLGVAVNTVESWLATAGTKNARTPDRFQQIGILQLLAIRPKSNTVRWAEVDWSKPTAELAKQQGRTLSGVSFARRRYAPETLQPHGGSKSIDWSETDWSLPMGEIARAMNVSRSAVYLARKKFSPAASIYRKSRWKRVDWNQSNVVIAGTLGVSRGAVSAQRINRRRKNEG